MDSNIRSSPSYSTFKKKILNFIRPCNNDVPNVSHPKGFIFLPRPCVGLSHLREHRFKHIFLDTLNPICICALDIETLNQFYLRLKGSPPTFLEKPTLHQYFFMAIHARFSAELNSNMLNLSIDYILSTKRIESDS